MTEWNFCVLPPVLLLKGVKAEQVCCVTNVLPIPYSIWVVGPHRFFYTIYSIICVFITSRPWLGPKPSHHWGLGPGLKFSEAWAVKSQAQAAALSPSWAHTSLALSLHPLSTVNLCLGHPLCPHPTLQPWLQLTHSVPMPSKLRSCPSFQIHQQNLGLLGGSVSPPIVP